MARETKAEINKWEHIKLEILCTAKETIIQTEGQPTEWKKLLENHTFDMGLISKICKELIHFNNTKQTRKMVRDLE